MATNDIPLTDPSTRPAQGAGSGRPAQQPSGSDSDLSAGPSGANGLSVNFTPNTGGTPLIEGWQQIVEPGGAKVAGSDSAMALYQRVTRTNTATREFLERINPGS